MLLLVKQSETDRAVTQVEVMKARQQQMVKELELDIELAVRALKYRYDGWCTFIYITITIYVTYQDLIFSYCLLILSYIVITCSLYFYEDCTFYF
jgi:hypothetical protein